MSISIVVIACYALSAACLYLGLMIYYSKGIKLLHTPAKEQLSNSINVGVVICFRDEEENLPQLLKSLINQNYPTVNYEILLYNDSSTDGSLAAIKNIEAQYKTHRIICHDVQLIKGCNSPKKMALNHAAANSKADLIVVTDADCILNPEWLSLLAQNYIDKKTKLIAAPVAILPQASWINDLQCLEMHALTAVTAGAIGHQKALMCNGANLAFDRKVFLELDPYKNNHHISSGDDMFLLMEMQKKYSKDIVFLASQNTIVYTMAKKSLSSYLSQRIRWASKSKNYQVKETQLVALLVLNMNAVILFSPLLMLINNWLWGFAAFLTLLLLKQIADMVVIKRFSKTIHTRVSFLKLFLYQYLEALLTVVIALKSIKGSYVWKNRKQHF